MFKGICEYILNKPANCILIIVFFIVVGLIMSGASDKLKRLYWIGHDYSRPAIRFSVIALSSYLAGFALTVILIGVHIGQPIESNLRAPPTKVIAQNDITKSFNTISSSLVKVTKELEDTANNIHINLND